MRPGGWIIIDNILWSGKVLEAAKNDQETQAIKAFNYKINLDKKSV